MVDVKLLAPSLQSLVLIGMVGTYPYMGGMKDNSVEIMIYVLGGVAIALGLAAIISVLLLLC